MRTPAGSCSAEACSWSLCRQLSAWWAGCVRTFWVRACQLGWTAALRIMSTSWTTPARATLTSSGKLGNLHFIFKTTKCICFVSCVITRRNVVWNRRFGSTCRSHLQGSSCPRSLILEDGTIGCPETAVLTLRRVMMQETKELSSTVAETCDLTTKLLLLLLLLLLLQHYNRCEIFNNLGGACRFLSVRSLWSALVW